MRIGLSTAAFYGLWETEDAAAQMEKLPIDCAEVFLQSHSEYAIDFVKTIKSNLGKVSCTSIHPHGQHENFMAQRPMRQKQDAFDTFRRILDAGAELGAKTYVYHGRHTPQLSALKWNLEWNAEAIHPMIEEAEKRGMEIGWENVFWCQLNKPEHVMEARRLLPKVKFTLDIKQAMRSGYDPIEFLEAMGSALCNVHVCDWNEKGELCLPGEGIFDFDSLFSLLNERRYRGPVILEPYRQLIKGQNALYDSIEYLRSKAKK